MFSKEDARDGLDTVSRFVPFKDDDQKVFAIMIVVIDVSELKQAHREITLLNSGLESKVAERTEQLAFSNKELESFSYSVAHDLRTPLRAVAGYATMLLEDYTGVLDQEGTRMLNLVDKNARKMGALIDDLLAFSKLGRKTINKSKVDMNYLVNQAFADLNLDGATLAKISVHDLAVAFVDEVLIKQVLVNLISNAIKYSSKNADAHIDISSVEQDGNITYSISDNGVGFDMAYADKLFGVFQRLHSANDYEGTGVGLAIVQRIISRHDGKVWAVSVPGKGTTFSFTLPTGEITKTAPTAA